MLQRVAVTHVRTRMHACAQPNFLIQHPRCNTLLHAETHCAALQNTEERHDTATVSCNTLQHTASCCNTLKHAHQGHTIAISTISCNTLQHTATRCSTMQCSAMETHCNALQCTATQCNRLLHTQGGHDTATPTMS